MHPMILMVVVMGGLSFVLPKLMAGVDPEVMNEVKGVKKDDTTATPVANATIVAPRVFASQNTITHRETSSSSSSSSSSAKPTAKNNKSSSGKRTTTAAATTTTTTKANAKQATPEWEAVD
jgi:hypothetical protein